MMHEQRTISRWTPRWMDFRAIRFVWIGIVIRGKCIYRRARVRNVNSVCKMALYVSRNFENAREPCVQAPRFVRDSWKSFEHQQLSVLPFILSSVRVLSCPLICTYMIKLLVNTRNWMFVSTFFNLITCSYTYVRGKIIFFFSLPRI